MGERDRAVGITPVVERSADTGGEWVTPPVSYIEPRRISCALCGRPIARRYWRAAPAGESHPFCDPSHAELYLTYWIPVYGTPPVNP